MGVPEIANGIAGLSPAVVMGIGLIGLLVVLLIVGPW
jgi:hypothetical protein